MRPTPPMACGRGEEEPKVQWTFAVRRATAQDVRAGVSRMQLGRARDGCNELADYECFSVVTDPFSPFNPPALRRIPQTLVGETCRHPEGRRRMWDAHTTRKPLLSLRLFGWLLLRLSARALS